MICHWDDVESGRAETGHLASVWADLGSAAGTQAVGVKRITVDPGKWSTPAHVEGEMLSPARTFSAKVLPEALRVVVP